MRETWLMCTRDREAEPVLVVDHGAVLELVLDDGTRLAFERDELMGALRRPVPSPPTIDEQRAEAGRISREHGGTWRYAGRDDEGQPVWTREDDAA